MNKERLKEIDDAAKKCIRTLNPDAKVPFPFDSITEHINELEVIISTTPDDNVSGFITYDPKTKKFKIFANSDNHPHRVNFTLAHELGHYYLHRNALLEKDGGFIDSERELDSTHILYRVNNHTKSYDSIREREANRFAARILMPEPLVREAWEKLADIITCAKVFEVSAIAMTIRLQELGYIE